MKVITDNFDPYMSIVSHDNRTGEFIIVTQEWDREGGNYWSRSVEGFKSNIEADEYLKSARQSYED